MMCANKEFLGNNLSQTMNITAKFAVVLCMYEVMVMRIYCLLLMIALVVISSCRDKNVDGKVKINRLDMALYKYYELDSLCKDRIMDEFSGAIGDWFLLQGVAEWNDSVVERYSQTHAIERFSEDIQARFTQMDSIQKVLSKVECNMANSLNGREMPEIYSVVSPYNQSIFITDSLIFVGLNHYLGKDYRGYDYFEPYQRNVKTPKHLPYDVAEAVISSWYPYRPQKNATVLNMLLYNGAVVYALMNLVPNAELSELLGYTAEQLNWLINNESEAWNALIVRKLLYSPIVIDAERLVLPAPATTILHPESPGRAGRYIGYKIVSSYMKSNSGVSLSYILSPAFYNSEISLVKSGYQGM